MEVKKNHAEVNWQYSMVHQYQAEANKSRRIHWTPCRTLEVKKNQAEVNWQDSQNHQ